MGNQVAQIGKVFLTDQGVLIEVPVLAGKVILIGQVVVSIGRELHQIDLEIQIGKVQLTVRVVNIGKEISTEMDRNLITNLLLVLENR